MSTKWIYTLSFSNPQVGVNRAFFPSFMPSNDVSAAAGQIPISSAMEHPASLPHFIYSQQFLMFSVISLFHRVFIWHYSRNFLSPSEASLFSFPLILFDTRERGIDTRARMEDRISYWSMLPHCGNVINAHIWQEILGKWLKSKKFSPPFIENQ